MDVHMVFEKSHAGLQVIVDMLAYRSLLISNLTIRQDHFHRDSHTHMPHPSLQTQLMHVFQYSVCAAHRPSQGNGMNVHIHGHQTLCLSEGCGQQ
jgi:hypothetical protein